MTSPVFLSTKTYTHSIGLSAAFRQWRAESHCRFLHGYSLEIKLTFVARPYKVKARNDVWQDPENGNLDIRNWVVDFGSLKSFKGQLEDTFDHKTLVAQDDPEIETFRELHKKGLIQMVEVPATGCERFAELVYECASIWLRDAGYADRCDVYEVEVLEHGANSAIARNPKYFHNMAPR